MDRLAELISKLKEQYEQKADSSKLLGITMLIERELTKPQPARAAAAGSSKVSVSMPAARNGYTESNDSDDEQLFNPVVNTEDEGPVVIDAQEPQQTTTDDENTDLPPVRYHNNIPIKPTKTAPRELRSLPIDEPDEEETHVSEPVASRPIPARVVEPVESPVVAKQPVAEQKPAAKTEQAAPVARKEAPQTEHTSPAPRKEAPQTEHTPAPRKEAPQTEHTPAPRKEPPQTEHTAPAPRKEVIAQDDQDEIPYKSLIKDKPVARETPPEKKHTIPEFSFNPLIEIPTLAQQQSIQEINEMIGIRDASLNDKLKDNKTEIGEILKDHPIRDLKKAIGVNDRYVFINELFRGDEVMYDRSLKTINSFRIFAEAEYWIERELKVKLGWEEHKETTRHFYQLVRRRFS